MASLFDQPAEWEPPVRESVPTVVWCDRAQFPLVRRLEKMCGLRLLGVAGSWQYRATAEDGGEGAGGDGDEGGGVPGEMLDDVRRAVVEREARLVLALSSAPIDAMGDGSAGSAGDDEDLRAAAARSGAVVLSLSPITRLMGAERGVRQPGSAVQIPLFVRSPMMGDLREVLAHSGSVRSLVAHFRCGRGMSPASGRLFDAVSLAHAVLGEPEQVDAVCVPAVGSGGVRGSVAGSFAELRGDVLCTLRYTGGHGASVAVSDCCGRWSRGFTITTDEVVVRATDRGFEVLDHSGKTIDSGGRHANTTATGLAGRGPQDPNADAAAVIGAAIIRLTDPHGVMGEVFDAEAVLATCQAAALSARTGQGESPATMRHVRGR
ncbi:MAG: hypothetical protein ACTS3F_12285 [Phycisphaerales bacterium]